MAMVQNNESGNEKDTEENNSGNNNNENKDEVKKDENEGYSSENDDSKYDKDDYNHEIDMYEFPIENPYVSPSSPGSLKYNKFEQQQQQLAEYFKNLSVPSALLGVGFFLLSKNPSSTSLMFSAEAVFVGGNVFYAKIMESITNREKNISNRKLKLKDYEIDDLKYELKNSYEENNKLWQENNSLRNKLINNKGYDYERRQQKSIKLEKTNKNIDGLFRK